MPPRPEVPPQLLAAARGLVGPAAVLRRACRALSVCGAAGAALVWLSLCRHLAVDFPSGTIAATLAAAAVGVAPWWLRHAAGTFEDVVALPRRLQELGTGSPVAMASRGELRRLRTGGIRNGAGMIRTTIAEVSDFVSPASAVLEVVAPTFWVWTATAAAVAAVLTVAGPIVALTVAVL